VVNTARGEVIDENALIRMLEAANSQAQASTCSNMSRRSIQSSSNLLEGNVVLLPHMGSATIEGRIEMGEKVIINIKTFMDGHRPPDRVLPHRAAAFRSAASPAPVISLITSIACKVPITPVSAPMTPASAQEGTSPGGGASGNRSR
jgi:hypothetical protein